MTAWVQEDSPCGYRRILLHSYSTATAQLQHSTVLLVHGIAPFFRTERFPCTPPNGKPVLLLWSFLQFSEVDSANGITTNLLPLNSFLFSLLC